MCPSVCISHPDLYLHLPPQTHLHTDGRKEHKVARPLLNGNVQHVLGGLVVNQPAVLLPTRPASQARNDNINLVLWVGKGSSMGQSCRPIACVL